MAVENNTIVDRVEIEDGTAAGAASAVSSLEKVGTAFERLDKAVASSQGALNRWRSKADEGERALQMLIRAETDFNRAIRAGESSVEEKTRVLDALWKQTIGAADAANQNAIAMERERQAAESAQRAFNQLLGVNTAVVGSARASATAFEEAARAQEEATMVAAKTAQVNDNLRSKYVPLHAAQQQYLASLREIRTAGQEVFRTEGERVAALQRTKEAFAEQVRVINGLNPVLQRGAASYRSFGGVAQQAGFQVGDFAVQVASGQSAITAFVQQGTQLLQFFGPWGAVLGAAAAVVGALYIGLSASGEEAEKAEKKQDRLAKALQAAAREADAAERAESILAAAVERTSNSTGNLTDMSFTRASALRRQQEAALATAQAEIQAAEASLLAAQTAAELDSILRNSAGGDTQYGSAATEEASARLDRFRQVTQGLAADIERLGTAQVDLFKADFEGPLQAQVDFQERLATAYGVSAEAVRKVQIAEEIRQEQARAGVTAESGRGQALADLIRKRELAADRVAKLSEAERQAEADAKRSAEELRRLNEQRAETIENLELELAQQTELRGAHERGAEAVQAVTDAREAYATIQKLKLASDSEEAEAIAALVVKINDQKRAIEDITEAQKEAERAAKDMAKEQQKAAEDAEREWRKVMVNIADFSEEALGDSFFDLLKGETTNFAEFFEATILRALANVLAAAATQQIVIPIATQVVGSVPGLFGLGGQAAGVAQRQAGGLFSGNNPLSSLSNIFGGGNSFNNFAMSGLGQALGLSYGAGTLATAPGMFFAGGAVPGAIAVNPALTLAATGPGGGFGTLAGLATGSTGGAVGATTAGGALASSGGLTGLGSTLAAAAPYLAIAAIALPLLMGMFGGNPSVGPVGVADFAPGLGRRRAFDQPLIDAFTADNGGNGEAMRPIAEAIADIIADSADRFSATIDSSLRFRVANYASPESGSGRMQGFEVNAFIRGEAEKRVAEGLSQEQAVFEALKFAVQEAFTFDSATIAEAAANTAATTTDELLAALSFADELERTGQAIADLGGQANATTVALARQEVERQNAAREFAKSSVEPIIESIERALELFPAETNITRAGRETVRGVYLPGGDGDRRFVEEDDPDFGRYTSGDNALQIVTQIRTITEEVTERSRNYTANLERVSLAIDIATASVDQLGQQIAGTFDGGVLTARQAEWLQTQENIAALRDRFEDMNEQIREANQAFPELNKALVDVDATISQITSDALAKRQETFNADIQAQMNAATGLAGLNTIQALLDARDANISDARALGIAIPTDGPNRYDRLFEAQLRQQLSGASLADLGRMLSSGQIVDAGARAIVDTILQEQALAEVRQRQLVDMAALTQETQRFADAANDNARRLRQAAEANLVDRNLSPLTPLDRLAESERQLLAAYNLANDDDPTDAESQDAIARLPELVQRDNELARDYYASSVDYASRFERNQGLLNSTALRQESIEEQMLSKLGDIEAAIIAAGGSPNGNLSAADRAAAQGYSFGANVDVNKQIYNALVAAGLPTPEGFGIASGNLGQLRASNPAVDALVRAMGYAAGGAFIGGVPVNFFASGAVVNGPAAFGMRSGLGIMGEAGPEAIMPLDRIGGRLGVRAIVEHAPAAGHSRELANVAASVDRLTARFDRMLALMADSGEANMAGLAAVADGIEEVRQTLRRAA